MVMKITRVNPNPLKTVGFVPTEQEALKALQDRAEFFGQLYSRWQDEKEYEDFGDYIVAVKLNFSSCTGGTKRPFTFSFKTKQGSIKIKVTSRSVEFYSLK